MNPNEIRGLSDNERKILGLMRRGGALSRADLARACDLTPQSMSRLVEGLGDLGLLSLGDKFIHGRGQPGVRVELKPDAAYALGVSIMTDAVSLALVDLAGGVLAQRRRAFDTMRLEATIDHVAAELDDMIAHLGVPRERLCGAGIALPGFHVAEADGLNTPDPLEEFAFQPLSELLGARLGLPVWLENDGNAAAVGEALYGVGRRTESFGYILFSHGLGGGVVLRGEPLGGAHGNAGEFAGVLPAWRQEDRPTLELLRRMANDRGAAFGSVAELLEGYDSRLPGVEAWIERAREPLRDIVSAIYSVIDPQVVVLGGRLPPALAQALIPLLGFHNQPRRGRVRPGPEVVASEVAGDAATVGAAALPLRARFFA